jgi:hypothetical protein
MATMEKKRHRTRTAGPYVGLAPRTLEKLRVIGGGPKYSKLGRAVVYDEPDLDEWVESRKRSSTSEPLVA